MPYLCNLFGDFYCQVLIEFLAVDEDIRLVNGGGWSLISQKKSLPTILYMEMRD